MSLLNALGIDGVLRRKSARWVSQIPRAVTRVLNTREALKLAPPLIANSVPKSGTRLLAQILEAFPGARSFGTTWASMPSRPHRELSKRAMLRKIARAVAGELVHGHLFYEPEYPGALARMNAAHYFIYRDPRDVVVSEAHYLAHMNRWHGLHRYFKRLPSLEDGISLAIQGAADPGFPHEYPNIAERFDRYRRWLDRDDVFSVRYEDVVLNGRRETIQRMAGFYLDRLGFCGDVDEITDRALENINPRRSRTFRNGTPGEWKKAFTPENVKQFKEVAGELLVNLGYEENTDWAV